MLKCGYKKKSRHIPILNKSNKIKFDVIDTWRGSPEHQIDGWDKQEMMINDTAFDAFQQNMLPAKGYYNPIRMSSIDAASMYEDNSIDMVFIDADHEYESVMADVAAWYPKIKSGGVLAGHDLPYEPVQRAVIECFGNQFIDIDGCWAISKQ